MAFENAKVGILFKKIFDHIVFDTSLWLLLSFWTANEICFPLPVCKKKNVTHCSVACRGILITPGLITQKWERLRKRCPILRQNLFVSKSFNKCLRHEGPAKHLICLFIRCYFSNFESSFYWALKVNKSQKHFSWNSIAQKTNEILDKILP